MYAEYGYYQEEYLSGREPVIPETEYAYWEKQARQEIDKRTMGRITKDPSLVSDNVKECACELAELLYRAGKLSDEAYARGEAGPLASYSNDGESGTYDLSQSVYTENGAARKRREIIIKHLAHTGLLYTGVG